MADSEKLTALKKAYADILLNTAKEAAARIMVSERMAQRYQRELFAAKDESLGMLLRLKQMLDSKVNETEISSLSQQRRIEELEAQLGEAEDIVKDLRAESQEVEDELEKVKSKHKQSLGECNSECQNATFANATEDNIHGNFDFASMVMRRKEPELYKNGCTQRIHAFERKLSGGTLTGQFDCVNNQEFFEEKTSDLVKGIESDRIRKRRKIIGNRSLHVRGATLKNQIFVENEVKKFFRRVV